MKQSSGLRRGVGFGALLHGLQGVPECESPLLWNETEVMEMGVNIELLPGTGHTLSCPLEHGFLRDPNNARSGSEVIVPLAIENVGLFLVAASYACRVFEPFCHRGKMASFCGAVN